ncbi:MAG: metallophosphoesterase [Deltaproteobacteria bacterium]|nr:metallophosphoesterase [Deltaproteobacteria bacterium]
MRSARSFWALFLRWFFAHFFQLLLVAISISQWVVLWWFFGSTRTSVLVHFIGMTLAYGLNRQLVVRTRQHGLKRHGIIRLPRLYYAVAFTSLFCALFLFLDAAAWAATRIFLGALTVEASGAGAALATASPIDTVFRWLGHAGTGAIMCAFAYGYSLGQQRLKINQIKLPLHQFGTGLDGLRIAQISDIHIGQNLVHAELERFTTELNALQPDLICITGDIADSNTADLDAFLPILAKLQATYGVFAILGNHDHYAGAERVVAALQRHTPFTILRDQVASIDVRGQRLHVIGVDDRGRDWARGAIDVPELLQILDGLPAEEPKILLSHRPDVFPQAAGRGVALTLSGHTHGGQLAMPWFNGRYRNLAEFITPFDRGLYERDGRFLYVNCGLGVTGQRIRLCTPREISIVEAAASPP